MSRFDHLDIDGHLLHLLVTVIDAQARSRAPPSAWASRSRPFPHLLDKLRGIVDDPLFASRGAASRRPARAEALASSAHPLAGGHAALHEPRRPSTPRGSTRKRS